MEAIAVLPNSILNYHLKNVNKTANNRGIGDGTVKDNILVYADNGKLVFTKNNGARQIQTELGVRTSLSGRFSVNYDKLYDISKTFPADAQLHFFWDDSNGSFIIKKGPSHFRLATLDGDTYPVQETLTNGATLKLTESDLKEAITKVQFSAKNDGNHDALNGILFEIGTDNMLRLVATDGFRMALGKLPLLGEIGQKLEMILPQKAAVELNSVLANTPAQISMSVYTDYVSFIKMDMVFTSKLIQGSFPPYRKAMNIKHPLKFILDNNALKESIKRALLFGDEKTKDLRFEFQNTDLKIHVDNKKLGSCDEEVAIVNSDDFKGSVQTNFNGQYLLDALNAINAKQVCIHLKNAQESWVIQGEEIEQYRYVIMPIRTKK